LLVPGRRRLCEDAKAESISRFCTRGHKGQPGGRRWSETHSLCWLNERCERRREEAVVDQVSAPTTQESVAWLKLTIGDTQYLILAVDRERARSKLSTPTRKRYSRLDSPVSDPSRDLVSLRRSPCTQTGWPERQQPLMHGRACPPSARAALYSTPTRSSLLLPSPAPPLHPHRHPRLHTCLVALFPLPKSNTGNGARSSL
jgi:hypothetical protein